MHAPAHYAAWDSAPVADRHDNRRAVGDSRSIDDLDHAICTLARQMNAETYRMLVLVREFDERLGWQKWGLPSCAEWLAWRCGVSLSAAREKVRTAHALREMPAVAAAFEDGRLSYTKVRALTRVVEYGGEETLLAYALDVTAAQVDERCREIRNANPDDSTAGAFRAWEHRSLTVYRDRARGMMKITVDVPIEDGEVIAQAIERAAEVCDAANGLEFAAARKFAGVRDASEAAPNGWRAQQCDALLAIAKASLAGASARLAGAKDSLAGANPSAEGSADQNASADSSGAIADVVAGESRITIRSSSTWTVRRYAEGPAVPNCLSRRCDGWYAMAARSRCSRTSAAHRSTSAASSARCQRRSSARSGHATAAADSRAVIARASSTRTTSATGPTAEKRASTTSCCSARITIVCYMRAASRSAATRRASSISGGRTAA